MSSAMGLDSTIMIEVARRRALQVVPSVMLGVAWASHTQVTGHCPVCGFSGAMVFDGILGYSLFVSLLPTCDIVTEDSYEAV